MLRILLQLLIISSLSISFNTQASTTWVPISNGSITIIIPFIPNEKFNAPLQTQLSYNGQYYSLSWENITHASRYQISALNSEGVWVNILETDNVYLLLDNRFNNYTDIKITACNYNSCNQAGESTNISFAKKSYQYDALGRLIAITDPLNGNRKYEYDPAGNRKKAGDITNN